MANDSKTWRCGKYELSFDRPRIMGVLNVTPDSFSDGGEHFDPDAAIEYGLAMLDAGADIIDVGGESTRPGFTPVNPDEEARRVLPVVRALAKEGAIVSIDTRHVAVAKAAVRCGASIVNDVTGFTDSKMVEFVKTSTCGVIVMHAGEVAAPARTHATVQLDTSAAAFVAEKAREAAAEAAREAEKPARRRRGKLLGEPKPEAKLPGGVVQPSLPFGEPEPATEPASEQETPAAEQAAAAETVAPAPEATEAAPEPNDHLAAMMRRSARREEAYVPTSQLRRFTLPDSAPIMRRVMGFLSDQARALIHAGVSRDRICIDPGPGFGKTANEDIVIQRETAVTGLSAHVRRIAQALCGRRLGRDRGRRARCRYVWRVPGRHPGRCQHRARARRRGLCAVPERLLGGCQAAAAPRVCGRGLQPGASL